MQVDRKALISALKTAQIGLSAMYEILEQSTSFIISNGRVRSFNDDVYYEGPVPLEIDAIVPANDLLKLLERFPDEEINISLRGAELIVKGKRRSAGLTVATDLRSPMDEIPRPGKWKKMPEDMPTRLQKAAECCGNDYADPLTTMIHVTPERVEGCDNIKMFRQDGETGFPCELLIPATAAFDIAKLRPGAVSVTEGWVHWRLKKGSHMSTRCSQEAYHEEIDSVLDVKGVTVRLPRNLPDILERAAVMQMPRARYEAQVTIKLAKNTLTLTARKEGGWFRERRTVKWKGPTIEFSVHPDLLADVFKRSRKVIVGDSRMKLDDGTSQFVIALVVDGK